MRLPEERLHIGVTVDRAQLTLLHGQEIAAITRLHARQGKSRCRRIVPCRLQPKGFVELGWCTGDFETIASVLGDHRTAVAAFHRQTHQPKGELGLQVDESGSGREER
jgi:hypothetical protein